MIPLMLVLKAYLQRELYFKKALGSYFSRSLADKMKSNKIILQNHQILVAIADKIISISNYRYQRKQTFLFAICEKSLIKSESQQFVPQILYYV